MNEDEALAPDHDCRRDDKRYASAGDWYRAHRGRVPSQAAQALDRHVRKLGVPFGEAFTDLHARGAIVLVAEAREADEG